MEKFLLKLLSITFVLSLFTQITTAQSTCIVKDSIIGGSNVTEYQLYSYDLQNRLVKVVRVDSGDVSGYNGYDTLIYGLNGMVSSIEQHDGWTDSIRNTTTLSYNGSDQIITIAADGVDNGGWTMEHTVNYTGGVISSIIMTSVTGQPEGFAANFTNIVYSGGNMASLNLEADFDGPGPLPVSVFELSATYDTKNSLEAQLYVNEASDLIGFYNANNILTLTFDNQEVMGNDTIPAGAVAMASIYTYTGNDVETWEELPGVFDDNVSTTKYFYDCTQMSIDEQAGVMVDLFPNPFTGSIQVNLDELNGEAFDLVLVNILGVEVLNERYTGISTVNLEGLEDLKSGLYFLQVKLENSTITRKLIKE